MDSENPDNISVPNRMGEPSSFVYVHHGDWHWSFQQCSYIKCGWGLGISRLGQRHWSCCFSTDNRSMGCCQIKKEDIEEVKYVQEKCKKMKGELQKLKEMYEALEKRTSIIEFSPPPQGGPEFRQIEQEELQSGIINTPFNSS